MLQSVMTFVDAGYDDGDHFTLSFGKFRPAAHQNSIEVEVSFHAGWILAVNAENVIYLAVPVCVAIVHRAKCVGRFFPCFIGYVRHGRLLSRG